MSVDVKNFNCDLLIVEEAGLIGPIEFFAILATAYNMDECFCDDGDLSFLQPFKQLVLIGDSKQMLPRPEIFNVFTDQFFSDIGLDISVLLQFIRNNVDPDQISTLDRCYRGPAAIFAPLFHEF